MNTSETNAFGLPRYQASDIFTDDNVVLTLEAMFQDWFKFLEIDPDRRLELLEATFNSIKDHSTKTDLLDEELRKLYQDAGVITKIREKMQDRAQGIYHLIEPFLGNKILDIGCGTGEIAQYIHHQKKGVSLRLTDILDNSKRECFAPDLPFDLRTPNAILHYPGREFDTSLLIYVLHHSDSPLYELGEAIRVTGGNIIILESIYGIDSKDSPKEEVARFPELYQRFHALSPEQQRKYGTFLDWFLNKMIISNEVNCPYNFNTPHNWEEIFREKKLIVQHKQVLGIDQPVTPEYHLLYVVSTNV